MTTRIGKRPLADRFDHLVAVISSQRFLKMESLNNDIPFFICDYRAAEAVEMAKLQRQLINRLGQNGVRVLEINLYDLSFDLLQARGGSDDRSIWDQVVEEEPGWSKESLLELLQNVLDPREHLIPEIARRISVEPHDVLFLTGIGEVFPYLRSHNILNNLQSTAKDRPTVMFFPGGYQHSQEQGTSLNLFDQLHDDKYYRAFNIFDIQV
ncbi:DUF1788 domain-containing protein [Luteimonas sp. A501]